MRTAASLLIVAALCACRTTPGSQPASPVDSAAPRTEQRAAGQPLEFVSERLATDEAATGGAPWTVLFDGRTLDGWSAGVYGDDPELAVTEDGIVLPIGVPMSGITYDGSPPRGAYTLEIDATKQYGSDFFLGVTFPVQDAHLTLILGGWGGVVCGLSNLDGEDASENESRTIRSFPNGKRYRVQIDVDAGRVTAFVDGERLVDQPIEGRRLSTRPEVAPSLPLGLASFATVTTVHRVRVRPRVPHGGAPDRAP